ncbi:MAG: hypothetical protein LBU77_01035 [Clostridiales bacterium]|nr:hypothetical protein [Clostridiales bacterium]
MLGNTVYAADAVDMLHNGQPPTLPTATAAPQNNTFVPLPTLSTEKTPEPSAKPEPTQVPELPTLYPTDVQGTEENGIRWIIKTYELGIGDQPEAIPRESFERDGWKYELGDIIKKETASTDAKEHTETVTVNTDSKEMDAIMKQLEPSMTFNSDDGYSGILDLDIATIKVETAGKKTSSYTSTATREYPHLSSNDTSLIPKTITDGGRTMTLQKVDWRAGNTATVDYTALPDSYTGVATYTATGSKTVVTGYVTTAEYKGEIAKLVPGKTAYIAYFVGTEIAPPTPKPTPKPAPLPEPKSINPVPIATGTTVGAGFLVGIVFFFFFRKNVKVHNLKDGKYLPIGKARVTAKNPIINLTPFAEKAATGSFILVIERMAAKRLSEKTLTINYGDKSFQHIVNSDGSSEYQFEIDF